VPGGQSKQHGTKEEEEGGPYMEVWTLPREKQGYAADAVALLVDSVLADAVLVESLLSLVLFVSLLSELLCELFSEPSWPVPLPFALPLRP
jgi:hypothetical protein